jgi:hypothetical protein
MLTTLTVLTGAYSVANISRIITNTDLVKNGKIKTLRGLRYIKPVDIINTGIMYKIYQETVKCNDGGLFTTQEVWKDYYYTEFGYTFETREPMKLCFEDIHFRPEEKKYFNTHEEYLDFCQKTNTDPKKYRFFEIMVECCPVTKSDEIWMLCNIDGSIKCEEMAKISESEFKRIIKSNNHLPCELSILFAFLVLFLIVTMGYFEDGEIY